MEYIQTQSAPIIVMRLDVGDAVIPVCKKLAEESEFVAAHISGIGAIKNFKLGYYDLSAETYKKDAFSKPHELTNATGFITSQDGKPHVHLHATVADAEHNALGGHLHKAEIAAAGEFRIQPTTAKVTRSNDEQLGLDLMDFSHEQD